MSTIRINDPLGEVLITARRSAAAGGGYEEIEAHAAARSVDRWFSGSHAQQQRLAELQRALHGTAAKPQKIDARKLLDWARQALIGHKLGAYRRIGAASRGGAAPTGPETTPVAKVVPPPAPVQEEAKPTTWIAIALVGEDGKPVPGIAYRIALPDASVREGALDSRGQARCDDIDPGTCQVGFPDLDRDAWEIKQGGGPEKLLPATGQGESHTVAEGESVIGLSEQHGLFAPTIWDDPNNAELKRKRTDMNILAPGDVLVIMAKRLKEVACATTTKHVFKRKGIPAVFRLRLVVDGDQPRAREKFKLTIDGAKTIEGATDGDGVLQVYVSAQARRGDLVIGPDNDEYTIEFSQLHPPDSPSGIRQRLRNLGYAVAGDDGDLDDDTKAVLRCFQREHDLKDTGEADDATRKKLADLNDRIDSPIG